MSRLRTARLREVAPDALVVEVRLPSGALLRQRLERPVTTRALEQFALAAGAAGAL